MPEPVVPAARTIAEFEVERWHGGGLRQVRDQVAEELPVALVYEDVPHGVMLATPADLEDFAVGFTLSEGLVERPEEIRGVEVRWSTEAAEARVSVAWPRFTALLERRRRLTGRTGCGLCGVESPEAVLRPLKPVGSGGPRVSAASLHGAIGALADHQRLNALTGSVHAAAWVRADGGIETLREDLGRHNALDKLIGARVRAGADLAAGWVLLTSRASFEMVHKCATTGVTFVAALSAPTALAVRLARESGVTLVAFARERQHVVYAHPERLLSESVDNPTL
jgi:FdhD protein